MKYLLRRWVQDDPADHDEDLESPLLRGTWVQIPVERWIQAFQYDWPAETQQRFLARTLTRSWGVSPSTVCAC
jgi:hypothetical protein